MSILDFKALTKIQSAALIAIIVVAAISGATAYLLWNGTVQPAEDIIVGVCADLDGVAGRAIWRGAVLAAEQINAQGGIIGRNLTVVGEDDDSETLGADIAVGINALNLLITVDKADYIIAMGGANVLSYQDACCEHKKIFIGVGVPFDEYAQRVSDDYEKYKYSFRSFPLNYTVTSELMLGEVIAIGKYTGFTKIALLFDDFPMGKAIAAGLSTSLPDYGFEVVYNSTYSFGVTDFTSYFGAIEASGAEIVVPWILTEGGPFVKEWYDRQSPFVVWGNLGAAQTLDSWNLTGGKCEYVSFSGFPVIAGYPLTNRTLPTRQAFIQRWGEVPYILGFMEYDALRFILADAIKRAGTTETEAVIKALESTNVETSSARHFVFTSSHDVMVELVSPNNPSDEYFRTYCFQWQNGTQVPMYPEALMKEAGATYEYPPWQGPWSK